MRSPAPPLGKRPSPGRLALALGCCSLFAAAPGRGQETPAEPATSPQGMFDSRFLLGSGRELDLRRFQPGALPEGVYRVDVVLNGVSVGNESIRFVSEPDGGATTACLEQALLLRLGVLLPSTQAAAALEAPRSAAAGTGSGCRPIAAWLPHAEARLDASELRLELSIAQSSLKRQARGYVDPTYWDHGIVAGVLEYNLNHYQGRGDGRSHRSTFLDIESGVNLGAWQWRHAGALSWTDGDGGRWRNRHAYLRRQLPDWHGQLQIGDQVVADPLLGSIGVRGAVLESDERMYPESRRGFAPVIRGIAESNAMVEIHQGDTVMRRFTVAPGPFEIDDIYAIGGGVDLEVRVIEADGRTTRTVVPYAFNPYLVRAGGFRYRVAAGRVRDAGSAATPWLLQASARYGLSNRLTAYGGTSLSDGYRAALLGGAWNTASGAWSLDVASSRVCCADGARSDVASGRGSSDGVRLDGTRWRLGYNKTFGSGGAAISATLSHSPDAGFRELRGALDQIAVDDAAFATDTAVPVPAQEPGIGSRTMADTSLLASLSLPLGERTALYANGHVERHGGGRGTRSQYQLGVRGGWKRASYALAASRTSTETGDDDDRVLLTVTVPLGAPARRLSLYASSEWSRADDMQRLGVSGGSDDGVLDYSASLSRGGGRTSAAASVIRRSAWTTANAFAEGDGRRMRWGLGASGVAIAHAGGVTLGPLRGETYALVEAEDAQGASIVNVPAARIGRDGYGIAPYLSAYVRNVVEIDPATAAGVEVQSTARELVPYAGAVVVARYETTRVDPVLVDAIRSDGRRLPFAAEVLDDTGEPVGVVGQGGRVYLRRMEAEGRLQVRWGAAIEERCWMRYRWDPTEIDADNGIKRYPETLECATGAR